MSRDEFIVDLVLEGSQHDHRSHVRSWREEDGYGIEKINNSLCCWSTGTYECTGSSVTDTVIYILSIDSFFQENHSEMSEVNQWVQVQWHTMQWTDMVYGNHTQSISVYLILISPNSLSLVYVVAVSVVAPPNQ